MNNSLWNLTILLYFDIPLSLAHREGSALMEINMSALWDSIKTRVCFRFKAGLSAGFLLVFENQCGKLRGCRGWPLRFFFTPFIFFPPTILYWANISLRMIR